MDVDIHDALKRLRADAKAGRGTRQLVWDLADALKQAGLWPEVERRVGAVAAATGPDSEYQRARLAAQPYLERLAALPGNQYVSVRLRAKSLLEPVAEMPVLRYEIKERVYDALDSLGRNIRRLIDGSDDGEVWLPEALQALDAWQKATETVCKNTPRTHDGCYWLVAAYEGRDEAVILDGFTTWTDCIAKAAKYVAELPGNAAAQQQQAPAVNAEPAAKEQPDAVAGVSDVDAVELKMLKLHADCANYERLRASARVVANKTVTVNKRLEVWDQEVGVPPTASLYDLGRVLGCTAEAIRKTEWWQENRRGEQARRVAARKNRLQARGSQYEVDN